MDFSLDDYQRELDLEAEFSERLGSIMAAAAQSPRPLPDEAPVRVVEARINETREADTALHRAMEDVNEAARREVIGALEDLGVISGEFSDGNSAEHEPETDEYDVPAFQRRQASDVNPDPMGTVCFSVLSFDWSRPLSPLAALARRAGVYLGSLRLGHLEAAVESKAVEKLEAKLARRDAELARLTEERNTLLDRQAKLKQQLPAWYVARTERERVRHETTPGRTHLVRLSHSMVVMLEQAKLLEQHADESSDHSASLMLQVAQCEQLLRTVFWADAHLLVPAVLHDDVDADFRRIAEDCVADSGKVTLGLTVRWIAGYRRALAKGVSPAVDWTSRRFVGAVRRHSGETMGVKSLMVRRELVQFIEWLRVTHRNPLMHAREGLHVAQPAYRDWCSRAYACSSLEQWLDVGLHPRLHSIDGVGWISFLAAALKPETVGRKSAASGRRAG